MEEKILIVDDEESVVQSIEGVLKDEGFRVLTARSGQEAINIFKNELPLLVLLDIWMPGMDGIEILKRMKWIFPEAQIIMISGHATISTAMTAIRLGAFDFIEKPLSLDTLLATIKRAIDKQKDIISTRQTKPVTIKDNLLGLEKVSEEKADDRKMGSFSVGGKSKGSLQGTIKQSAQLFPQQTLKKSMVLYGTGLHSGMKTGLLFQPLPPHSGILFGNISSDEVVPAHIDYVETTEWATCLRKGKAVAKTIEHLMAVLHAYRITNLMIKMIEEIQIMDGSAIEFCKIIEEAGIEEQEGRIDELVIDKKFEYVKGNKSIIIEPSEVFSIHFFLEYPPPIGRQSFNFTLENVDIFKEQIAPARTFGFLRDVEMLGRMVMGGGGRLHNFILVDDEKVVNTELRFPDEFVRHKILDLIGDFYLLGRPIKAKVTARLTGHSENIAILKKLQEALRGKDSKGGENGK